MVSETNTMTGHNMEGELSVVTTKYKLDGDTELIAVKGASHTVKGKVVTVTTDYVESIAFNIVVKEAGDTVIYPFVHNRVVSVSRGKLDINTAVETVRPVAEVVVDTTPSVVEINKPIGRV